MTGGYNGTISTGYSNPIGGRQAWTGNSGGFITTTVNLPSSASGRDVKLSWRVATDSSLEDLGAFIDSITITGVTPPPTNDNFINAQPILGSTGRINGSNLGATKEARRAESCG